MKGTKGKLASILLAGSILFSPVYGHAEESLPSAAVETEASESTYDHEIGKRTVPIYYGNAQEGSRTSGREDRRRDPQALQLEW